MSLNYEFVLDLASETHSPPARLLDFGCGEGHIVRMALERGFEAYGADTYSDGWAQLATEDAALHRIGNDGRLPFPDAHFDVAVTNMVLEHIRDLGPSVTELARVVRPGGTLVTVFPTREVLWEAHAKAPLVHRFQSGSTMQRLALALTYSLMPRDQPRSVWEAYWEKALEDAVFYRPTREALGAIGTRFNLESRREPDLLRFRLKRSRLAPLAKVVQAAGLGQRPPRVLRACGDGCRSLASSRLGLIAVERYGTRRIHLRYRS